jgi:hypothetical protein
MFERKFCWMYYFWLIFFFQYFKYILPLPSSLWGFCWKTYGNPKAVPSYTSSFQCCYFWQFECSVSAQVPVFILVGALWASWTSMPSCFLRLGKFFVITTSNRFSDTFYPCILPSLRIPHYIHIFTYMYIILLYFLVYHVTSFSLHLLLLLCLVTMKELSSTLLILFSSWPGLSISLEKFIHTVIE